MKICAYDIEYSERTREWNVTIENLAGWKQYSEDPRADKSTWNFGNFMTFGADLPTEITIDAPFDDPFMHLDEIDALIKEAIRQKTSRDVKSYKLRFF